SDERRPDAHRCLSHDLLRLQAGPGRQGRDQGRLQDEAHRVMNAAENIRLAGALSVLPIALGCGPRLTHSDAASETFGFVPLPPPEMDDAGTGAGDDGPSCAEESYTARPVPVDVFLVLDASASMNLPIAGGGSSKWGAIRKAITSFIEDPRSA